MIILLICLTSFTAFCAKAGNSYFRNEDETSNAITAVSGRRALLFCPIKTVSEIKWEKDGERLPIDHRQQIHLNGTLIIENVRKKDDDGSYICLANDFKGNMKRRHLTLRVIDGPKILPFEFPTDLQVGVKLRVMCSVSQGDQPLRFSWIKNGFPVNGDSGLKIQNFKDYSILSSDNIELSHAGNISCTVSNDASQASYSSILKVNAPPIWTIEPKDSEVILDTSVRIDCVASGSPQPYITWKRATGSEPWDFIPIYNSLHYSLHSNGSLEIRDTTRQESGYYVCHATNGYGSDIGKLIQLTVNEPPRFHVKIKSQSIKRGETAELDCTSTGQSPIQINWRLKDDDTIVKQLNGKYIIKTDEDKEMKEMSSKLIIENVISNDTNVYICHATNKYGSDESLITLIVNEPPGIPHEIKFINVTEQSIILSWSEPYRGNSVITNYLIHYKLDYAENSSTMELLVNGSMRTATINNLKANSHYLIRIASQNKIGKSEFSDWIKVKTEESAPESPPINIVAVPTGPNSVKISWKAPPKNSWNGQINGYYIGYRASNSDQDLYKTVESLDEINRYESHLTNLLRSTIYYAWVQAFNNKGTGPRSDEVSVKTLADVPPSAPLLKIFATTTNSITISWSQMTNFGNSVYQYTLYQRSYSTPYNSNVWKESTISTNDMKQTINNLECGQSYEFYMTAHNSVGKSEPSSALIARTDGAPPLAPTPNDILSNIGSNEVTINLMSWRGGGCPISHFSIKTRLKLARNWNIVTSHHSSTQNYIIKNLMPNSHYDLEIIAHNSAGSTQSLSEFTTLNVTIRETIFRVGSGHKASSYPIQSTNQFHFSDYEIMLPIISSIIVVILILVVSCCICSRDASLFRNSRNHHQVSSNSNKVPPFQVVSMKELSTSRVIEGTSECDNALGSSYEHSVELCNNSSPSRNVMHAQHNSAHHYALPYDILPVPQNTDQNAATLNRMHYREKSSAATANNIYGPSKNVLQVNIPGQRSNYEALVPIQNEIL